MKFLSTWLRNRRGFLDADSPRTLLNEVPEHMAQEFSHWWGNACSFLPLLNEVPEHMAQEFLHVSEHRQRVTSSMKFLSTWLRNHAHTRHNAPGCGILNEVPEHMAQEFESIVVHPQ